MHVVRWILIAALAFAFVLLAVSNWTMVEFILPDGSPVAVPLPMLLAAAFLAGVLPTWAWLVLLRPLAPARRQRPAGERTEVASSLPPTGS